MIVLLALGSAGVVDESDGKPLPGSGQRRTLALLSALAVATPRGLSRDKLVGLFWPDADSERASHALTQALYAARRGLQCDDLFLLGNEVRLNPSRLRSDVGAFEAAVASNALEEAMSLYRGPFLDGFFLTGSTSFERWQANERSRLEALAVQSLDRLSAREEQNGSYRKAVEWLRALAALEPLDSGVAMRLMTALALAGDRAGAIRHARVHSELLFAELDLPPDEEVASLSRRIRDGDFGRAANLPLATFAPPNGPTALAVVEDRGGSEITEDDAASEAILIELDHVSSKPRVASRIDTIDSSPGAWTTRRRLWQAGWFVAAVCTATALGGIALTRARTRVAPAPAMVRQNTVVMPFRVSGASASLGFLHDGIVELLSTRLAADSTTPAIDPGAVLGAWRASRISGLTDVPRDSMILLGARLGAERVVIGSVVGTRGRFVIQASAIRTSDASTTASVTVEGVADSLTTTIDRLAAKLLLSEAGEDQRLVGHSTNSISALRAFLAGQSAARQGRYSLAYRSYRTAMARDSNFALAALRLALVADEADDPSTVREGVLFAWEKQAALNANERVLLSALTGGRFPDLATIDQQRRALQGLVDVRAPNSDHWFALGSRLFHEGKLLAIPNIDRRAQSAIERTLVLNPNHFAAKRLAAQLDSAVVGESAIPGGAMPPSVDAANPFDAFMRWHTVSRLSPPQKALIGPDLSQGSRTSLREIALASQYDAIELNTGLAALRVLNARAASRGDTTEVLLGEHSLAMNQGRIQEALRLTSRLDALWPGTHADWRLRVLDGLYGSGDSTAALAAANRLERSLDATTVQTSSRRTRVADLCVMAQWRLAKNDTSTIASAVRELRGSIDVAPAEVAGAAPLACAELVDAGLAVIEQGRRARSHLARLDSLVFSPLASADAATFAPLFIARLHERLGDYAHALRALERRTYMTLWPRYSAETLKEEAHLAEIVADSVLQRAAEHDYFQLRSRSAFDEGMRPIPAK